MTTSNATPAKVVPDLKSAAQTALEVQDACNLSGVVHAFSRAMDTLWEAARAEGKGTEFVNRHPIVTMYLWKLAELNRTSCDCDANGTVFQDTWAQVEQLAGIRAVPAATSDATIQ